MKAFQKYLKRENAEIPCRISCSMNQEREEQKKPELAAIEAESLTIGLEKDLKPAARLPAIKGLWYFKLRTSG